MQHGITHINKARMEKSHHDLKFEKKNTKKEEEQKDG